MKLFYDFKLQVYLIVVEFSEVTLTMEDAELLETARKTRSLQNVQTLEKLAMKAILKNFDRFSTTALGSLGKILL